MSKSAKQCVAIWILAIVTAVIAIVFINNTLDARALEVGKTETMTVVGKPYNPQLTVSGYKLQPTVSGEYLQHGYNPQQAANAKVLETATEIR